MRTTPKMWDTIDRIEQYLCVIAHCMISYNEHHDIKPVNTNVLAEDEHELA